MSMLATGMISVVNNEVDARVLPTGILWAQPQQDLTGGLEVRRRPGDMLHGDVDIPKEPLQGIFSMDGVGPGCVEQQVHRFDRFPHRVSDRQPGVGDFAAWVGHVIADSLPDRADGIQQVGAGGADYCFGFRHLGLDQRAVPEQSRRHGGARLGG